jgi:hypothetical protein
MDEPIVTPRAMLCAVIAAVAREFQLDPEQIKGRTRTPEVVHARTIVAKRLFARIMDARFEEPEQRVADMMHLSLSTVRIYLGKRARPDNKTTHHREDSHERQDGTEGSGASGAA